MDSIEPQFLSDMKAPCDAKTSLPDRNASNPLVKLLSRPWLPSLLVQLLGAESCFLLPELCQGARAALCAAHANESWWRRVFELVYPLPLQYEFDYAEIARMWPEGKKAWVPQRLKDPRQELHGIEFPIPWRPTKPAVARRLSPVKHADAQD